MNINRLVEQIEEQIYTLNYDDLSDYLKGVRDFINLVKGYEDSEIKNVCKYLKNRYQQECVMFTKDIINMEVI